MLPDGLPTGGFHSEFTPVCPGMPEAVLGVVQTGGTLSSPRPSDWPYSSGKTLELRHALALWPPEPNFRMAAGAPGRPPQGWFCITIGSTSASRRPEAVPGVVPDGWGTKPLRGFRIMVFRLENAPT